MQAIPSSSRNRRLLVGLAIAICLTAAPPCPAQEFQVVQSGNAQPADARRKMQAMRRAKMQQMKAKAEANKQKANENKPKKEGEPDKKQGEGDKGKGDTAITRPDKPPRVPDPRELDVEPVNGRVQFGFHGQPWPDVLQWLANVSGMSLDWQELPSGYLNLTTQRAYTLPEARDLINRHLQARGYLLLRSGEVLSVTKIDKLDPSLVPRVGEDELYDLQPHDFVKVTFQLPAGMDVKKASEDVKQVLSKQAKVLPLATTKRLLVIDAITNLRLVSALLNEERLERDGRLVPKRFPLKFARAEQVIETLYVVLGIDPGSKPSANNPQGGQMSRQQLRQLQRMQQQQQQGKKNAKPPAADTPKVHLAFNRHDNSILANAPPEQLAIIDRTITMLDIPPPGMRVGFAGDTGERYAKTYELKSIEPDSLIRSLEEIGNLGPLTDLRGDRKSKVLFARASESDHDRIEEIIKQLDGPKFRVEMYALRRHPADEVAGTIAALVGGKEEKKEDNTRRRRFWFYGYGGNDDDDEEEEVELRVEADIENNRLFVRGNDSQIAEVEAFLVQIGELPGDSPTGRLSSRPVRVFDTIDRDATDKLLEQLRAAWPALGGGAKLEIRDDRVKPKTDDKQEAKPSAGSDDKKAESRTTAVTLRSPFRFVADETDTEAIESKQPTAAITVTEDGRLVITSEDPELLARLEDLVSTLAPEEKSFTEFKLDHVAAWYVHGKLEDFYDEIINAGFEDRVNYWGEYQGQKRKAVGSRLSRRRQLRMVYNGVTNTIVVTNASAAQLKEIEKLIKIWDQPPKLPTEEAMLQRRTGMVKVHYSRASTIAAALKDVYRDLLSARDKEFDTEDEKGSGFSTEKLTQIEYSGSGATTQRTKAIETKFGGVLSIGVDELASMIVISADAELYDSVVDMIKQLDEQARPKTTVEVVRVGVPAGPLREALGDALKRPWPGGKPEQANRQQRGNQQRGNNQQQRQQNGSNNRRQQRRGR